MFLLYSNMEKCKKFIIEFRSKYGLMYRKFVDYLSNEEHQNETGTVFSAILEFSEFSISLDSLK